MEILYGKENIIYNNFSGVGLGNFDGLHIGHMALINTLISESSLNGLKSLVYTFNKHPENILRKKLFTPLITTGDKKISLLKSTPLDYLYFDEFDEKFSRMSSKQFINDILIKKLNAKLIVAGFNYRFGYKGEGDADLLCQYAREKKFKLIIIPPIKINNEIVSSSLIRKYIQKGNMEKVFMLLGRHYSINGRVTTGKKIGKNLGFPTANILPDEHIILPAKGVYVTRTLYKNKLYNSVTNIGNSPTVKNDYLNCVETHLLDFENVIYNSEIEVFFLKRIRKEKQFEDKDKLIFQIKKDIRYAREFIGQNNGGFES